MRTIVIAITVTCICAAPAPAELLRVEFKTAGNHCETCAHAVSVGMQKVEGVKSVAVSLKDGLTVLELREGNAVTLAQLRAVIKNNGLLPREANVVARGSLVGDLFDVRFSRERLRVRGQLAKLAHDRWILIVPAAK